MMQRNAHPLFPCNSCQYEAKNIQDHVQHQRIHSQAFNYTFVCPWPTCHYSSTSHRSLSTHVAYAQHEGVSGSKAHGTCCSAPNCDEEFTSAKDLCHHVTETHIGKLERVKCPIPSCGSTVLFSTIGHFRTHLSRQHPGWLQLSTVTQQTSEADHFCAEVDTCDTFDSFVPENINDDDVDVPLLCDESVSACSDDSSPSEEFKNQDQELFSDQLVTDYIACFYAMLEGKLIISADSVQVISEHLSFLSEIIQTKMKKDLENKLSQSGLPAEKISDIVSSVLATDPLYNTHHTTAPGVSLTTEHLRREYFKTHLQYVQPVETSVKKNPEDRSQLVHYIPVKDTLQVMLKDVTVQQQVDESFDRSESSPPNILADYVNGEVFRGRQVPKKRIDLLLYADGFNIANPLGSAKRKYKILGMFMMVGNLNPICRSTLKAIRLVLLTLEKTFNDKPQKCMKRLIKDLEALETEGILYKNDMIPVRVQFIVGDNLSQHIVGGFIPAFNVEYFCRFCEYTKTQYKEDQEKAEISFTDMTLRKPSSYTRYLSKVKTRSLPDYKGVRKNSPFHQLQSLHVCDPSLAPCIGHDIFIGGVVDVDLAAMVHYFVNLGWFTYDLINRRIRDFKCLGSDRRNKMAPLNTNGKTLGGHAVQNWSLLRLLPFIIGDKVKDTDEPIWKLYLSIKLICEYICAPMLSVDQVEEMKTMIKEYMVKRKPLKNPYKPKHHFFSHYGDLYCLLGPLIHLWTLRFEHRHSYFKQVARVCRNFKNPTLTLAQKHQLMQAYLSTGPMFPTHAINEQSTPLSAKVYSGKLRQYIHDAGFSQQASDVHSVTISNIKYVKDLWILLGNTSSGDMQIGKVKAIIGEGQEYKLLLKKFRATHWVEFGVYSIVKPSEGLCLISIGSALENPNPHPVYKYGGKKCFSLKHMPLTRN